eukprot:scaffold6347_cov124-Isochrysis_galbana.AAC.7
MSISSYASDLSSASPSHSCEITQSNPSLQSGMVQPVVNEMFATVHAAGSSLLETLLASGDSAGHRHPTPLRVRVRGKGKRKRWANTP